MKLNVPKFEEDDRVFDIRYGWGEVTTVFENEPYPNYLYLIVKFDSTDIPEKEYTFREVFVLAFKEYKLSEELYQKPVRYDAFIGNWGFFSDDKVQDVVLSKLRCVNESLLNPFKTSDGMNYELFTPLTQAQLDALGLKNDVDSVMLKNKKLST